MKIGQKCGKLTVINLYRRPTNRKGHKTEAAATCKCECGNVIDTRLDGLKDGNTKSCGCLQKETAKNLKLSHGCGSRDSKNYATYSSWQHMKDRCLNEKNRYFINYGGRGITICEEWKSFENFLADMGEAPKGYLIERINNEKGYYKENCKWSSFQEQMNNTRRSHFLEYKGEKKTIAQWAKEKDMSYSKLISRIKRGWSTEKALEK